MMRSAASSVKAARGPAAAAIRKSVTVLSGRRANSSSNRSKRHNALSSPVRAAKPTSFDHRESANGKTKFTKAPAKNNRSKAASAEISSCANRRSTFQTRSAVKGGSSARGEQKNKTVVREPVKRPRLADTLREPLGQDAFSENAAPGKLRLVLGRSGDHAAVYHTMLAIFQNPSREEFRAQTEDPFYEPNDRLLVKRGYRVLSHLQLTHRTMLFGNLAIPVAGVHWLGTLPEFRNQGFASRLLQETDRRMVAAGAALGMLRTSVPHFFRQAGWALCGHHSFSQAKARDVLGHLHSESAVRQTKPLNIRLWRHVEMPALMRIYRQNTQGSYGSLERTEAYWRWLVGRKAYDSLFVALDGPDKLELEETIAPIVGYAVLRQDRVVELFAAPNHPTAAQQLLARACSDTIEHDRQELFVHAPPNHELHQILTTASGTYCRQEMAQNEVYMMKIVDPLKFLHLLAPEFEVRAKSAGLPRGTELGLQVDDAKWRLVYSRHGFRVRIGKLGRSYLTLNRAEFTRLALGHGRVQDAAFAGRIQNSTRRPLDLAEILFPQLPFWRPGWDELPV